MICPPSYFLVELGQLRELEPGLQFTVPEPTVYRPFSLSDLPIPRSFFLEHHQLYFDIVHKSGTQVTFNGTSSRILRRIQSSRRPGDPRRQCSLIDE